MNWMCRTVLYLFLIGAPAAAQNGPTLVLSGGQRIKVESKTFDSRAVTADSIELADPDDELEIEGPINKVDRGSKSFGIGWVSVQVTEETKIENAERQPTRIDNLADGMRVKVKAKGLEGRHLNATQVRIYQNSGDRDFEIVAPIERIDPQTSELSMLSLNIRITEKTIHPGIDVLETASTGQYIRRDDDEPARAPLRLGPMFLGGKLRMTYEETDNLDLDAAQPDGTRWLGPSAELEVSTPLGEHSQVYGRFNVSRPIGLKDPESTRGEADFRVYELFLEVGNLFHPGIGLQIGRQRIRDSREWLFDERLDSIRLHVGNSKLRTEFAAARAIKPTTSSRDQLYLISRGEYRFAGQNYVGAHFIKRNDVTADDEDPIWFGLSARGRPARDVRYWLEVGRMKGRSAENLLRGHAYDAGLSYRFRQLPLQPTIAAGYAFGSGDNDLTDGIDGNFRQTSLQDNSHRIGGLKRYRFYGVVTEPELNNVKITTADLGLRHGESWSLNFIYHTYRQVMPARRTGDIELERRPRGRNASLGRELDMVLAVRKTKSFDFFILSGVFVPGPAYDGPRSRAFVFRPEFYFYF